MHAGVPAAARHLAQYVCGAAWHRLPVPQPAHASGAPQPNHRYIPQLILVTNNPIAPLPDLRYTLACLQRLDISHDTFVALPDIVCPCDFSQHTQLLIPNHDASLFYAIENKKQNKVLGWLSFKQLFTSEKTFFYKLKNIFSCSNPRLL